MADPIVTVEPSRVSVQPGGQARAVVTITNPGSIVDGYRIDVVDEVSGGPVSGPAVWSQVLVAEGSEPTGRPGASLSLYPQQRAEVVVVFSPGSGSEVPGGTFAFGVRVVSVVDRTQSAVAEGILEVGTVFGLQAKLVPVTSTGRWTGRHVVQISNWGNAPARLRLVASDPDQALGYLVRPEVVDVPLGGSTAARIKVRTRRPRLRGQVSRLPFSVVGEPDARLVPPGPTPAAPDPARPVVDGAFSQKPILSRGVVVAAALTVVAALAVGGFALTRRGEEPTLAELGIPSTPVLTPAVAVSPSQIKLAWVPIPNLSGYELLHLSTGSDAVDQVEKLDKSVGAHQVKDLESGQQYCFQLRAVRGDVSSPPSEKTCATTSAAVASQTTSSPPVPSTSTGTTAPTTAPTTTPGAPTTPSVTTTGGGVVFAATDWIAMVYVLPADAPGAQETVSQWQAGLVKKQVAARILLSSSYPGIGFKNTAWVVYLGPFSSKAAAEAACTKVQDTTPPAEQCLAIRPAP